MSLRNLHANPVSATPSPVFQTPESNVMDIPKEFPDVFASQYYYPEKVVVTETIKPKETWSEILYRRAGITKK